MAVPNQFAIREIAIATFYDLVTGKAKVQLNNLKTSGIENSATVVYARGGRGNPRVVGFSGEREGKVTLQDAVFTGEVIAMMTGNPIKKGTTSIYQREVLKVGTDKATLSYTPATTDSLISVYKALPDGSHGDEIVKATTGTPSTGEYKVAAKVVSFKTGELSDDDEVIVYYQAKTDAEAKTITVSSDKFAGTYRLVLDCLVRDTFTKQDFAAQFVIHNAKMEDGWKIEMAATGDPSVFDIPIEILKPVNTTEMYTMTVFDESTLT